MKKLFVYVCDNTKNQSIMSRLEDLYNAIEAVRKTGLSLDAIEKQLSEAEEEYISVNWFW